MTQSDKHTRKKQKRDMTQGNIWGHVFRMAGPMVIGIGSVISFSIADTYFIGQLGPDYLAAISYTFPVTTLFFNIVFGMAIAMSAVISRKIGAGAIDDVRVTATVGIATIAIVSSIMALLGKLFLNQIFQALGAGQDLMPMITDYMNIWLVGSIFLSVPVVANSAIRGMGDAISPSVVMITIAVVNIILDPILIFGLFGAPQLGIQGAAIASMIAYFVAMVTALSILGFREKALMPLCLLKSGAWKLGLKSLLVIAIPVSLANLITPLVTSGYTRILSHVGDDFVAGYGVSSRLEAFALIPIMAVAGGIAPLIGQNYGAGLHDRVQEAMRKSLKFGVLYGLGCGAVFALLSHGVSVHFSDSETVQQFVQSYLMIVPMSYLGLNIFLVLTSAMNAMEKPKTSLVLNLIKAFAVGLPAAWVLVHFMGVYGFYYSIVVTNIVCAGCALYYLKANRCMARTNAVI